MEEPNVKRASNEFQSPTVTKDNALSTKSPTASNSRAHPSEASDVMPTSTLISQLYDNVYDLESSATDSISRQSFGFDGDESRIDLELRHLVGGEVRIIEGATKEEEDTSVRDVVVVKENAIDDKKPKTKAKSNSTCNNNFGSSRQPKSSNRMYVDSKSTEKSAAEKTIIIGDAHSKKQKNGKKLKNGMDDPLEPSHDNPNIGPYLLKHARDLIQGDNHHRALNYAIRASKSFEKCENGRPSLDLVMSLHVLGAIYCGMGQHALAVPVLERAIEVPMLNEGQDHALAKFTGHMQLGDTYAMMGQLEKATWSYSTGLELQKEVLGESDPRVGETYRHLAEIHLQALQFNEAERLCRVALDIHRENGEPSLIEEIADRRLMGLICEAKRNYEEALEHLVLASMAMVTTGQEIEVASIDCSIGDIYLSLTRYDEAIFSYQKALTKFKSSKGENHSSLASTFIRLANLYNKTGKIKESKSYCENALRIYARPPPSVALEDIANGFVDVSSIYQDMNEHKQALSLLQKALTIYDDAPSQQSTIAGIEAQMGVLHYIMRNFLESYLSLKSAITKFRAIGNTKSAFFGIALNQMGLACVQQYAINEAAELFEEAGRVLEQEYGPYHPDTLAVQSNLAGAYDAMGRLGDAIEILEDIIIIREDKLGTANPTIKEEKRRLTELLREAGKVRRKTPRSLENLLITNHHIVNNDVIAT